MCFLTALFATALSPLFLDVSSEVRTTYVSLGKIMEDRPMQVTGVRFGADAGPFGRFGIRNWDVSSLTGRRSDTHRHAFYHTELGPTWQYDFDIAEGWKLKNDLTRSWTMYRGFNREHDASNRTYHWWQIEQSLENPYIVPFSRLRRTFRGKDFFYAKVGIRHRFPIWEQLSFTPSVFTEGGHAHVFKRTFGRNIDGTGWGGGGLGSVSFRFEFSWRFCDNCSAFAYVEQYDVVGGDQRRTNGASTYRCAHNDWTHGGIGLRLKF